MTDDVTINVVEGKTGPRLTFSRPVAFVEVPYGSVPELIKELVLEYGRQRTGLTQQNLDATVEEIAKSPLVAPRKGMMDADEVNEWATTPKLRDFEARLKALGFTQYPGRLGAKSQHDVFYETWCNGVGEGKEAPRWHPKLLEDLNEMLITRKAQGYNGIVWRVCPSFEMRARVGRILRMRFHFIHVTNT